MKSIKVFEYSRSRSFDDDLILQGKASGERSQDQWSSGLVKVSLVVYISYTNGQKPFIFEPKVPYGLLCFHHEFEPQGLCPGLGLEIKI